MAFCLQEDMKFLISYSLIFKITLERKSIFSISEEWRPTVDKMDEVICRGFEFIKDEAKTYLKNYDAQRIQSWNVEINSQRC